MVNSYQELAVSYKRLLQRADMPLFQSAAGLPARKRYPLRVDAACTAIFSPHPDDECIVGLLPLRLMQEAGYRVHNIALTLGSQAERQASRWQELCLACAYLGFETRTLADKGLSGVTLQTKVAEPLVWQSHVAKVGQVIDCLQPEVVCCPHANDGHPTHEGTHALVLEALSLTRHPCWLVQTEFWQPLPNPNVMVESSPTDLADLMTALACHVGEVSRNPYHLRLPAWMADNVRRGAERIAGKGQAAPDYAFATLYRIDYWDGHALRAKAVPHFIPATSEIRDQELGRPRGAGARDQELGISSLVEFMHTVHSGHIGNTF